METTWAGAGWQLPGFRTARRPCCCSYSAPPLQPCSDWCAPSLQALASWNGLRLSPSGTLHPHLHHRHRRRHHRNFPRRRHHRRSQHNTRSFRGQCHYLRRDCSHPRQPKTRIEARACHLHQPKTRTEERVCQKRRTEGGTSHPRRRHQASQTPKISGRLTSGCSGCGGVVVSCLAARRWTCCG
jgi:hypothetical protein